MAAADLARGLAARGWSVHVVSASVPFCATSVEESPSRFPGFVSGVDEFSVLWHSLAPHAAHEVLPDEVLWWPRFVAALGCLVDLVDPVALNPHYAVPYAAACLEASGGRPVVASLHGTDVSGVPSALVASVARSLRSCSAVTAVSAGLAARARSLFDLGSVDVIAYYHPSLRSPLGPVERSAVRSAWGLASDAYVAVHVSNFRPVKQAPMCLDALKAVRDAGRDAVLVLVGDGPDLGECLARAKRMSLEESVVSVGVLRDPCPLIAASDALWLPSRSEGLSRVALEAASAGVPTVAFAGAGMEDAMVLGRTGLLASDVSAAGFASAAVSGALDSRLVGSARSTGPSFASGLCGEEATVGAYDRLFRSFL